MPARQHFKKIVLDYDSAASDDLLMNLSAVASHGPFLWTASDEGRTVECLKLKGKDYQLHRQFGLDTPFPDLPGNRKDEVDIESIDIAGDRLWICGSNCRIRLRDKKKGNGKDKSKRKHNGKAVQPDLRLRPSECLFGAIKLKDRGGELAKRGETLPFVGDGSLRDLLASDAYLAPFLNLPSKENGVDIEGLAVVGDRPFFGLRGPVIGGSAVVVEVLIRDGLQIDNRAFHLHFLDLDDLGVRDLAHAGDGSLLVLAGPVNRADGPFRIHRWTPNRTDRIQHPGKPILNNWTKGGEKPEGICFLEHKGANGILIVYDKPRPRRLKQPHCYIADWFRLPD